MPAPTSTASPSGITSVRTGAVAARSTETSRPRGALRSVRMYAVVPSLATQLHRDSKSSKSLRKGAPSLERSFTQRRFFPLEPREIDSTSQRPSSETRT